MKTKIFKSVLPFFAAVFAIGLAFATEAKSVNDPAYYDDPNIPGIQTLEEGVDCPTEGIVECTHNGFQLYADPGLTMELYKRQ
ncbi:DUF6520 family protein [Galbibacter mesophilus]|uniref:DUF6520 family protein n=1 Tax=Galbibacter mesophilus TaxID=379069 RepID=UPI00191E94FF|nr:DUF6520 family protein [Galbibacter mesophilus]MCM5663656.1 DUF6520 family protein [Galbibacter mesophilus]